MAGSASGTGYVVRLGHSKVLECALSKRPKKEVFMLKKLTVICGLLLAATAAVAWNTLPNVPSRAAVTNGTHLIWGDTLLWGIFPTDSRNTTFLYSYNPNIDPPWDTMRLTGVSLNRTGLAFQWVERPVVWVIGEENGISWLYRYDVRTDDGTQDTLKNFDLGIGAAVAYAPNEGYNPYSYPIPGWLYFLPGDGTTFWRYWIPAESMPDVNVYGHLYPGDGVTIADPTPPFRWSPAMTTQYRIQVASDQSFTSTVIDTVVTTNQCQSTTQLSGATYYWRVATWNQGGFWDAFPIGYHHFTRHPGWDSLPNISNYSGSGAKLAFCDAGAFGHEAIVAMFGQGYRYFAEYAIGSGWWNSLADVPKDIDDVSSLTTNAAVGAKARIYAAFEDDIEGGCPHMYDYNNDNWGLLNDGSLDTNYNTHFRDDISAGSSMALGANSMMYLTTGNGHKFYDVNVSEADPDGQQARDVPSGNAKARVLTARDGVQVEYQLPAAAHVRASLRDALGRRVGSFDIGKQTAGTHRLAWHGGQGGRKLSAGAYFVLIDMGTERANLKAVIE
jgi:hypothetical protein